MAAAALAATLTAAGLLRVGWVHGRPEHAPADRGARLARELGCWPCHRGAEGPGERPVPSLFGGPREPTALRAAIRDVPEHAAVLAGGGVTARDVADLAAWIALVQLEADRAAASAAAGPLVATERLARRECFGCHGELGQGGTANPGSLKGYVPGFFGRDFDTLTAGGDPAAVRQWIRDGEPAAFRSGVSLLRLGPWITARQQVRMPAYARSLDPDEIEALVAYLGLLRRLGPLEAEDVARYRTRRELSDAGKARATPALPRRPE
jgi:mono/diheme cytochrome c family protein